MRLASSGLRGALAAAALLALAGCAANVPLTPPAAATPPAATTRPTPTPAPATTPKPAAVDTTTPSPEARQALATIPEPLPPSERVSAPTREQVLAAQRAATPAGGISLPAPAAAYDTLRQQVPALESRATATVAADSGAAEVPVPSPTQPLGDRPGTLQRVLAADSSVAAAPPTAPAPPVAAPAPSAPAPAAGCWRVQVGAPAESKRAAMLRAAAESQLLVPFVVEHERRLYKVRTKDCVDDAAAESLKRRAALAGFGGVFKFAGGKR